jgi:hypothetical protein
LDGRARKPEHQEALKFKASPGKVETYLKNKRAKSIVPALA